MSVPRPRRIVLWVALVATLTLLCCGGSVTAILLGGLTDDQNGNKLNAAIGCGKGGPVDPDSKLPRIRQYGAAQIHNAAIIINVGSKAPIRGGACMWCSHPTPRFRSSGTESLGDPRLYGFDERLHGRQPGIGLRREHDVPGRKGLESRTGYR